MNGVPVTFIEGRDWKKAGKLGEGFYGECWSADVLDPAVKQAIGGCTRLCVKTVCNLSVERQGCNITW